MFCFLGGINNFIAITCRAHQVARYSCTERNLSSEVGPENGQVKLYKPASIEAHGNILARLMARLHPHLKWKGVEREDEKYEMRLAPQTKRLICHTKKKIQSEANRTIRCIYMWSGFLRPCCCYSPKHHRILKWSNNITFFRSLSNMTWFILGFFLFAMDV
jgi:hypothetical protein